MSKTAEAIYKPVVDFLTGNFPYVGELTLFWMAFQAAMKVRTGPNNDGQLHWFHAFVLTTITAFGGGMFNPIWMGGTAAAVSNDLCLGTALAAFFLVNYLPSDLGVHFGKSMPGTFITVMFAQLFRSLGTCKFTTQAFKAFESSPSAYYPIPVLGPIFYGVMLGNMGALVLNGISGYVGKGMPWGFQNGLFVAGFFHLYAHDHSGPLGDYLRAVMSPIHALFPDVDDRTFAIAFVSLFMQVIGMMQTPFVFGATWSPFEALGNLVSPPVSEAAVETNIKSNPQEDLASDEDEAPTKKKSKRSKSKNKKKAA